MTEKEEDNFVKEVMEHPTGREKCFVVNQPVIEENLQENMKKLNESNMAAQNHFAHC